MGKFIERLKVSGGFRLLVLDIGLTVAWIFNMIFTAMTQQVWYLNNIIIGMLLLLVIIKDNKRYKEEMLK